MRLRLLLRLLLGLLLLLSCLLLLLMVVRLVRYSVIRLTFVGRGSGNATLACNIRPSPSTTRVGTTGTMLVAPGGYRRVRLTLPADVATVRSTNATLHVKSAILLLSATGGERDL